MLWPNVTDKGPASFVDLMNLEKINETTYRSTTAAFAPGGALLQAVPTEQKRTYGGHVYAQAVWAAAHTVAEGMVVHSVTGFFTLLGDPDLPFVYSVHQIRSGKSYAVRTVTVTQEDSRGTSFTCTISFKKPSSDHPPDQIFQENVDIDGTYEEALQGKRPQDHPDYLNTEHPLFTQLPDDWKLHPSLAFPGLVTKKADMTSYNAARPVQDRRSLAYYAVIEPSSLPPYHAAPNLHACAHLYASDRNSLFLSAEMQGGLEYKAMASLSHTVIFHVTGKELAVTGGDKGDRGREGRWMCQEARTSRLGDGRITHLSRLWSGGCHVGTTVQDGMIRLGSHGDPKL